MSQKDKCHHQFCFLNTQAHPTPLFYPASFCTHLVDKITAHQYRHRADDTLPLRNKGSVKLHSDSRNINLNWGLGFYHQWTTQTEEGSSPSIWKLRIIRFYSFPSLEYLEINDLICSICFTPMAQSVSRVPRITVSTSLLKLRLYLFPFLPICPQWKTS